MRFTFIICEQHIANSFDFQNAHRTDAVARACMNSASLDVMVCL